MDANWTLLTICVGIVVVVGGILVLRLHAFLALTFGALTVALLTPRCKKMMANVLGVSALQELSRLPNMCLSAHSFKLTIWLHAE